MAMAATVVGFPQKTEADGFKGHDFLAWSQENQSNYIGIAVTMATLVATRTNPQTGDCLDQWYAASDEVASSRADEIKATIARNADYHPSAVILLVLEGACGSFAP